MSADEVETPSPAARKRGGRVQLPAQQWRQMQRDYEESDQLVQQIADHYRVTKDMLAKHAQRYGWTRPPRAAPPPLLAPPDPAQVIALETGEIVSAWDEIAH
ncbi:MAG TPA: hypothetical protein PLN53_04765, partial [Terricaulis sp.]|nr:hypothetical protein [Terricaulis sp.]